MPGTRILVTAHGHPDFGVGGGEHAAYHLFQAYGALPEVEASTFLARYDGGKGATGAIMLRRSNEYLWEQGISDWFSLRTAHTESFYRGFADLLQKLRPTAIHLHHYSHFGVEWLQAIRRIAPSIRIVLTLHEFMAICLNDGQMLKVGSGGLCREESPRDCHRCFPNRSIEDFWLRKHRIQSYFCAVDHFIAPSEFLRERYIAWGLPSKKITMIENAHLPRTPLPPRTLREGEIRNRFGFFGQITPFKGLDLLLRGLLSLSRVERRRLVLEVHGANLEAQPAALRQRIAEMREPLEREGVVRWIGSYEPDQMRGRLAQVDWLVVPSIWWENSPMVIQEAFALGRPVIAGDIGGMAEKVTDGVDGRHVQAGNSGAWARMMLELAESPDEWCRLHKGIRPPPPLLDSARAHLPLLTDASPDCVNDANISGLAVFRRGISTP